MPPQSHEHSDDQREREGEAEESRPDREDERKAPEDPRDEPGAGGGAKRPTSDKLPGMPSKDDPSPVGDTDQHSQA